MNLIRDLLTPSPGATPYQAGVMAMAHALLGAAATGAFGGWGLGFGLAVAAVYWTVKESGDILRGGAFVDGAEDAAMVWLGTYYGPPWWPAAMLACGVYVMAVRAWRCTD